MSPLTQLVRIHPPRLYTSIVLLSGKVVAETTPRTATVVSDSVSFLPFPVTRDDVSDFLVTPS